MITKIKQVRDFRSFNGWAWPHDLPLFKHVNLVYGINGTGKSTIASLLQQAALDQDWSSGLELDVTAASGSSRVVSTASDPLWRDVRVFNRKYVEANLQFEEQAGSTAAPLLVLGEQRVEAETERTRIDKRLADIAEQLPVLKREQKSIKTQLETLATDRARLIVQEVGAVGGRYAPRSYNATKVRQSIKGGIEASSAQADITKELSLARSPSKPAISDPVATQFSLVEIARQAQEVVKESAVSNALADLEDPAHSRWAQDGVELHKDRDACIFCASDISTERRQALAEHFDTSLLRLQSKVASLQRELDQNALAAKQAVAALPRSGDLFEMHQETYEKAVKQVGADLKRYLDSVETLAAALQKKYDSLLTAASGAIALAVSDLSLADVSLIITQHNATASDFEKQRVGAAAVVEKARVAEIAEEYRNLEDRRDTCGTAISNMESEADALRRELSNLNDGDLDPQPIATQLNDDLVNLLGRSDLVFEVEGQGYSITRNGSPARHLSEGERNAISLLYFLRSLETSQTKASSSIVVIDDPVSSLDGSMLVGASTHLWTRLVGAAKCRQLFLLTHNFELFRMWSSHLDHYPNLKQQPKLTHGVYEIRTGARQAANGEYVRAPVILSWPEDPKVQARLRSEYHYLFWRVSSALRDCVLNPSAQGDVEAATVLPNVCRRLLEGFLGFKYPAQLGNLHAQIMKASDGLLSEAMRARLLRFAHAYSHNIEADTTMPIARPEAVEMLHVVLEFMKITDCDHFEAMCEAVGVKGDFLIEASDPSSQPVAMADALT